MLVMRFVLSSKTALMKRWQNSTAATHPQQQAHQSKHQQRQQQQQQLPQQRVHPGYLQRSLLLGGSKQLCLLQQQVLDGGTMNSSSSSSMHSWFVLQAKAGNLRQLLHQQLQHSASTVPQLQHQLLQALLLTKLCMRCHTSLAGGSAQLQLLPAGAAAGMTSSSRSS